MKRSHSVENNLNPNFRKVADKGSNACWNMVGWSRTDTARTRVIQTIQWNQKACWWKRLLCAWSPLRVANLKAYCPSVRDRHRLENPVWARMMMPKRPAVLRSLHYRMHASRRLAGTVKIRSLWWEQRWLAVSRRLYFVFKANLNGFANLCMGCTFHVQPVKNHC